MTFIVVICTMYVVARATIRFVEALIDYNKPNASYPCLNMMFAVFEIIALVVAFNAF